MAESASEEQKETLELKTVVILALVIGFVIFCSNLAVQTFLQMRPLATAFVSPDGWYLLVNALGGMVWTDNDGIDTGVVNEYVTMGIYWLVFAVMAGAGIGWRKLLGQKIEFEKFVAWLLFWASIPGVWFFLWLFSSLAGLNSLTALLMATPQFWMSLSLAGMMCVVIPLWHSEQSERHESGLPIILLLAAIVYVSVFVAMNWGLYFNLMLPHGDSAMYEEHLWNIWHGKGFRSYLDQGLFLGEHIQVAHLILLPIHLIWPSHLMLELAESLILAAGAIPVYWMAVRHSQNRRAATLLAITYLLCFPLQFLDISIDLKTFRPINFGMVAMLFAIDQFERKRYLTSSMLLIFALSAKEDFAIVTFCFGFWALVTSIIEWLKQNYDDSSRPALWKQHSFRFGLLWTVLSPIYLKFALWLIVWFRSGVEVHYASYFEKFGNSTSEIIWNMLTDPALLISELATGQSLIYALCILFPLGFLPLFSPSRLLSAGPLFVLLCLNELASDPRHHFHAPILPLVMWAAAAGLGNLENIRNSISNKWERLSIWCSFLNPGVMSRFACCAAFSVGLWFSMSPLGVAFWDPGSQWNWQKLYISGERTEIFVKVYEDIPKDARVASTDYVHPRFTHNERSYDYSNYKRKVAGGKVSVPEDTDYIVIDTQHRYSEIKSPSQVREYQQEPEKWKLWPDTTNGYFIVLQRKKQ